MLFVKDNNAAYRIIESQAVILTPENSFLHTLNEQGTFIWEQLDGKKTTDEIADEMCKVYDISKDEATKDAQIFLQDLLRRKLVSLKK
jgi:hypothetical protein